VTRADLLAFLRLPTYWVEATVSPAGGPQAAVVGAVVSDNLELFFDSLGSSRKVRNLRADRRVALVAWEGERTAQVEGIADEPKGDDLARLKHLYFARFPDGPTRESWAGITYVRVQLTWVRFSDFGVDPPEIAEFAAEELQRLLNGVATPLDGHTLVTAGDGVAGVPA
jgi:Pyridoxamine 5'-phosphate oxidase